MKDFGKIKIKKYVSELACTHVILGCIVSKKTD